MILIIFPVKICCDWSCDSEKKTLCILTSIKFSKNNQSYYHLALHQHMTQSLFYLLIINYFEMKCDRRNFWPISIASRIVFIGMLSWEGKPCFPRWKWQWILSQLILNFSVRVVVFFVFVFVTTFYFDEKKNVFILLALANETKRDAKRWKSKRELIGAQYKIDCKWKCFISS